LEGESKLKLFLQSLKVCYPAKKRRFVFKVVKMSYKSCNRITISNLAWLRANLNICSSAIFFKVILKWRIGKSLFTQSSLPAKDCKFSSRERN
jgi:hypothetical protein